MRRGIFTRAIDDLIKLAFAGAAGFTVGKAAHPTLGVTAGDWLSFGGAILGVVLAIGGAVWIEDRKRSREAKENFLVLSQSISLISVSFHVIATIETPKLDDRSLAITCMQARVRARQGAAALEIARRATVIRNIQLLMALQELESWLSNKVFETQAGDNFGAAVSDEMIARARSDYHAIEAIASNVLELVEEIKERLGDYAMAKLTEF